MQIFSSILKSAQKRQAIQKSLFSVKFGFPVAKSSVIKLK